MRLLLSLACTLILLPTWTVGQSGREPAPKKDRLEEIEEHLKRAGVAHRAALAYAESLGLEGKSAKDAWDTLIARGFKCDIRMVTFGKGGLDENNRWVYWKEIKPLISCEKASTEIQDCVIQVSVSAKWQDPQGSPAELLQQAPSSPVDIVGGICR